MSKTTDTIPQHARVASLAKEDLQNRPSSVDTPRTSRSNETASITQLRDGIGREMDGEFVQCPVKTFIKHYLPFEPSETDLSNFITNATYKPSPSHEPSPSHSLAADPANYNRKRRSGNKTSVCIPPTVNQILEEDDRGNIRFIEYPGPNMPVTSGEDQTYSGLEKIMSAICTANINGRSRNQFCYQRCSNNTVVSDLSGGNNKVDACIIYNPSNGEVAADIQTTSIAVVFEFKLKPRDISQNNLQVVSANVQIMNDDVRRMFTYGVSIVGDIVTLWYHCRSHSAISEPFSFVKEPKMFLKAMMPLFFATEAELGYDPKVTRLPNKQLVFEIEDEQHNPIFYRTVSTLSEYRPNNITGRMARVWEVEQVDGREEDANIRMQKLVLKDVWLDASAQTERQIQSKIYAAIESRKASIDTNKGFQKLDPVIQTELKSLVNNEQYKKYFLAIVADFRGQVSKSLPPGFIPKPGLFDLKESPKNLFSHANPHRSSATTSPAPQQREEEQVAKSTAPRAFAPKRQYRSICNELCETVGKMASLSEVCTILNQSLAGLRILYFAGWVHRDISSGNIMCHRLGAALQAKLADLEYAKEYSTTNVTSSVDPKTGTPYFMAHEILGNEALLPLNSSQETSTYYEAEFLDFFGPNRPAQAEPQAIVVPVIHNFQHDLESIFWLLLYTITARVNHQQGQAFAMKVFKNTVELSRERSNSLMLPIELKLTQCLSRNVKSLAPCLEFLRKALFNGYSNRNANWETGVDNVESYVGIHNAFYFAFRSLAKGLTDMEDVPLINGSTNCNVVTAAHQETMHVLFRLRFA